MGELTFLIWAGLPHMGGPSFLIGRAFLPPAAGDDPTFLMTKDIGPWNDGSLSEEARVHIRQAGSL